MNRLLTITIPIFRDERDGNDVNSWAPNGHSSFYDGRQGWAEFLLHVSFSAHPQRQLLFSQRLHKEDTTFNGAGEKGNCL